MKDRKPSESGQALVLIVLGIVALLGFTALAIDGGRVYSDRRNMQNASDTSSLTAAASYAQFFDANQIRHSNWNCGDSWYITATALAKTAAINRAASNGYTIDTDPSDDNDGVEATCFEVSYGGFTDRFIDIDTYITAQTPSSFAQFVFSGPLVQTVRSTARVRPQTSLVFGNAIVSLNPADCSGNQNGVQFDGSQDVNVYGGGVLSAGCLGTNGSGSVAVTNGGISYGARWTNVGPGTETPDPIKNNGPLPEQVTEIDPPNCGGLQNRGASRNGGNLLPGNYTEISVGANETATLTSGLYCVSGGVSVNGRGSLFGNGVTIYLTGGDFDTGGGSQIQLTAPLSLPDPAPALPNVLIYLAKSNSGSINMLGNADSRYLGVIYAPDGEIEIGGSGSTLPTYNTQLIGYNVFVHGNATIDINFLESQAYQAPPNIDMQR